MVNSSTEISDKSAQFSLFNGMIAVSVLAISLSVVVTGGYALVVFYFLVVLSPAVVLIVYWLSKVKDQIFTQRYEPLDFEKRNPLHLYRPDRIAKLVKDLAPDKSS